MKKIRIGQIGIEHNHGEGKMIAVKHFPELFEVVGVAEESGEWLQKRGGLKAYSDLNFMSIDKLIALHPDAMLIETGIKDLIPTAQKCIDAGISVHIDKPALEYNAFEKLLCDARQKKLTVQMGYMYRYNTAVAECLIMIASGKLGEIHSINAEMSTAHSAEYRKWLSNFKGGAMYIFGCHLIDLIIGILGEPQKVISLNKKTGFDNVECEDNCFAILEYKNVVAKVTTSSVEVNGYGRRQLVVCGQDATVEIKPLERPTKMTYSDKSIALNMYSDCKIGLNVAQIGDLDRYDSMMREFYDILSNNIKNPYTFERELILQRTLLKACGYN